jgi:hypothetical protein
MSNLRLSMDIASYAQDFSRGLIEYVNFVYKHIENEKYFDDAHEHFEAYVKVGIEHMEKKLFKRIMKIKKDALETK